MCAQQWVTVDDCGWDVKRDGEGLGDSRMVSV